jgi:hypothetical protein
LSSWNPKPCTFLLYITFCGWVFYFLSENLLNVNKYYKSAKLWHNCSNQLYELKYKNVPMHFPVNSKFWLHFSRIHKNGFIAFWNQTLHVYMYLQDIFVSFPNKAFIYPVLSLEYENRMNQSIYVKHIRNTTPVLISSSSGSGKWL